MNMKKIVTIIALSTSMLSMAQNWDGTAEAWTSGSGSEQDPYILQTAGNIAYLTEQVNNGTTYEGVYFALGQDIDMCNVETLPIGKFNKYFDTDTNETVDASTYFLGTFDGKKHVIKNLNIKYVEESDGSFGSTLGGTGFFACLSNQSVIRQLTLSGKVTGGDVTGGFVGQMTGGLIEECCNEMAITAESYTGGIAGVIEGGAIVACYNSGEINGATEIGGIIGQGAENGSVSYCYNTASVTSKGFGGAGIGGALYDNFSISNCYSIGAISGQSSQWLGSPQAIVSDKGSDATVNACYYVADLAGVDDPNATEKSSEEMKSSDILSLLNGDGDYFTLSAELNGGFPVLKWQIEESNGVNDIAANTVNLNISGRTVSVADGSFTVYDLNGKRVANGQSATLNAGIYIIATTGSKSAKKLIIK
jgi:hypothetical protein